MTPLGHTDIALLTGIGVNELAPTVPPDLTLTGTVINGVALDLDLFPEGINFCILLTVR